METKQHGKGDADWLEEDFWADPEYANAALEGISALEQGAQTVSIEHLRAERAITVDDYKGKRCQTT